MSYHSRMSDMQMSSQSAINRPVNSSSSFIPLLPTLNNNNNNNNNYNPYYYNNPLQQPQQQYQQQQQQQNDRQMYDDSRAQHSSSSSSSSLARRKDYRPSRFRNDDCTRTQQDIIAECRRNNVQLSSDCKCSVCNIVISEHDDGLSLNDQLRGLTPLTEVARKVNQQNENNEKNNISNNSYISHVLNSGGGNTNKNTSERETNVNRSESYATHIVPSSSSSGHSQSRYSKSQAHEVYGAYKPGDKVNMIPRKAKRQRQRKSKKKTVEKTPVENIAIVETDQPVKAVEKKRKVTTLNIDDNTSLDEIMKIADVVNAKTQSIMERQDVKSKIRSSSSTDQQSSKSLSHSSGFDEKTIMKNRSQRKAEQAVNLNTNSILSSSSSSSSLLPSTSSLSNSNDDGEQALSMLQSTLMPSSSLCKKINVDRKTKEFLIDNELEKSLTEAELLAASDETCLKVVNRMKYLNSKYYYMNYGVLSTSELRTRSMRLRFAVSRLPDFSNAEKLNPFQRDQIEYHVQQCLETKDSLREKGAQYESVICGYCNVPYYYHHNAKVCELTQMEMIAYKANNNMKKKSNVCSICSLPEDAHRLSDENNDEENVEDDDKKTKMFASSSSPSSSSSSLSSSSLSSSSLSSSLSSSSSSSSSTSSAPISTTDISINDMHVVSPTLDDDMNNETDERQKQQRQRKKFEEEKEKEETRTLKAYENMSNNEADDLNDENFNINSIIDDQSNDAASNSKNKVKRLNSNIDKVIAPKVSTIKIMPITDIVKHGMQLTSGKKLTLATDAQKANRRQHSKLPVERHASKFVQRIVNESVEDDDDDDTSSSSTDGHSSDDEFVDDHDYGSDKLPDDNRDDNNPNWDKETQNDDSQDESHDDDKKEDSDGDKNPLSPSRTKSSDEKSKSRKKHKEDEEEESSSRACSLFLEDFEEDARNNSHECTECNREILSHPNAPKCSFTQGQFQTTDLDTPCSKCGRKIRKHAIIPLENPNFRFDAKNYPVFKSKPHLHDPFAFIATLDDAFDITQTPASFKVTILKSCCTDEVIKQWIDDNLVERNLFWGGRNGVKNKFIEFVKDPSYESRAKKELAQLVNTSVADASRYFHKFNELCFKLGYDLTGKKTIQDCEYKLCDPLKKGLASYKISQLKNLNDTPYEFPSIRELEAACVGLARQSDFLITVGGDHRTSRKRKFDKDKKEKDENKSSTPSKNAHRRRQRNNARVNNVATDDKDDKKKDINNSSKSNSNQVAKIGIEGGKLSNPKQDQKKGKDKENNKMKNDKSQGHKETRECYNCGRLGHLKKDCKTPVVNTIVARHDSFNRVFSSRVMSSSMKMMLVSLSCDEKSLYVPLPDSGAELSLISISFVKKYNMKVLPPKGVKYIQMADKSTKPRLGTVYIKFNLYFPETDRKSLIMQHQFEVFDCENDMIFGTDILPYIFNKDQFSNYMIPPSSITTTPIMKLMSVSEKEDESTCVKNHEMMTQMWESDGSVRELKNVMSNESSLSGHAESVASTESE